MRPPWSNDYTIAHHGPSCKPFAIFEARRPRPAAPGPVRISTAAAQTISTAAQCAQARPSRAHTERKKAAVPFVIRKQRAPSLLTSSVCANCWFGLKRVRIPVILSSVKLSARLHFGPAKVAAYKAAKNYSFKNDSNCYFNIPHSGPPVKRKNRKIRKIDYAQPPGHFRIGFIAPTSPTPALAHHGLIEGDGDLVHGGGHIEK